MTIFYGSKSTVATETDVSANSIITPLVGLQKSVLIWAEYLSYANGHLKARVVEHNGVVVTGTGPVTTVYSSTANNFEAVAISSTQVIVVWRAGAGSTSYAQLLTVSGTNITVSSRTTLSSVSRFFSMDRIDDTSALFVYEYSNGIYARHLYVSGSTVASSSSGYLDSSTGYTDTTCSVWPTDTSKAWQGHDKNSSSYRVKVISTGGPSTAPSGQTNYITVYGGQIHDCNVEAAKSSPDTCIATYRRSSDSRAFAETVVYQGTTTLYISTASTFSYHGSDDMIGTKVRRYDDETASAFSRRNPDDTNDMFFTVTKIGITQVGESHPYYHLLTNEEQEYIEVEPIFTSADSHFHIADDLFIVSYRFYHGPPDYIYAQIYSLLGIQIGIRPQMYGRQLDADLSDEYLFIAALDDNSNPMVVRFAADLTEDATQVYTTGSGTECEVFCSDQDSSKVWTGGDYGDVKVAVTMDGGASWEQRNPPVGSGAVARPFLVGPHSDNFLYDFARPGSGYFGGGAIYHTVDGSTWSGVYSASGGFTANCCDNAQSSEYEAVFAAFSGTAFRVLYTPDHFVHLNDITLTIPDLHATDVIIPY